MKRVNRAQLRGRPLDPLCKKAYTTTHEYGPEDKRVFCYGFNSMMTDEPEYECSQCGAFIRNMTPPIEWDGVL